MSEGLADDGAGRLGGKWPGLMSRWRIPAFWRAVAVIAIAYLAFTFAFPPVMPKSLLIAYMFFTIIGVLLYYSFDDQRFAEFKAPILAVLRANVGTNAIVRRILLMGIPLAAAFGVHAMVSPSFDPPVEFRQVHPAPPASLYAFGKSFDLTSLENPVRMEALKLMADNPDEGWKRFRASVDAGRKVYSQNCLFCHGGLLFGKGVFAGAFDPMPANFQDAGTIAQLQESYLFWRIVAGGHGLPREGAPWNSAMPAWQPMLSESDVWNVIIFLYDYVGRPPRIWDAEVSRQVTALNDARLRERAGLMGRELYLFHCAACHGEKGAGDGPAVARLYPKPRDFTTGLFKYKTSPSGKLARDEDIFNTIKFGLSGTAMPAWEQLFSDEQISSLIPVLKGFDIFGAWAPDDAMDEDFDEEGRYAGMPVSESAWLEMGNQVPFSGESVAKGKDLFHKKDTCSACHGLDGRGNITSGKKLKDDWKDRIWPRNLTKPWTWRASNVPGDEPQARDATIRHIFTRLSVGIPGTPMPEHTKAISEEDRWHIANYVHTLRGTSAQPEGKYLIRACRVDRSLPNTIDDRAWNEAEATTLLMAPNISKEDRLFTPLNDAVTVQALYNDDEIAFLLTVDDRTDSRSGEPVSMQIHDWRHSMHSDAFAIQFPKQVAFTSAGIVDKPWFHHGDAAHHTTIWHWNAGAFDPVQAPSATVFDAAGPNKRLQPRPADNMTADGRWRSGQWRVMIKMPRSGGDAGDIKFAEGQFIPVSFANWDGSNGEIGSRHSLTAWHWLLLPPVANPVWTIGLPAGAFVLTFAGGLLLVRSQRRKMVGKEGRR